MKNNTIFFAKIALPFEYSFLYEIAESDQNIAFEFSDNAEVEFSAYSHESESEARHVLINYLMKAAEAAEIDFKKLKKFLERVESGMKNENEYLYKYREYLKPFKVGDRLLVVPSGGKEKGENVFLSFGYETVLIDSFLAFGTGAHATTRMCLEALTLKDLKEKKIADAGTGSGILAIAAAKLGAEYVYAFDIDPVAVDVAARNVRINAVDDRISVFKADLEVLSELGVDIIVANLTGEIILNNLKHFHSSKSKLIILSGIIEKDSQAIENAFEAGGGYRLARKEKNSGWVLLEFKHV